MRVRKLRLPQSTDSEDLAQVAFRVESVQLGRAHQRVNGGSEDVTGVRSGKEIIIPLM